VLWAQANTFPLDFCGQLLPWALALLLAGLPHLLAGQQSLAGLRVLFTIQRTNNQAAQSLK